mgnify:FL=1|jgi:hypothetical protein
MAFPQIKKNTVNVVVRTLNERIEGAIYIVPETRLLDMLNKSPDHFLAVSNARVYDVESGKLSFETDFLIINKDHIVHMNDTQA